ncbi:MAG TPA: hypothetical protein PLM82_12455 [Candidatus Latescibacteria bacterium]|jgi:AraC-like DNA-binding protein|nr:hypothetical protein [Candidatus Latescibacterota bacterium]HRT29932.1 hypothetical protein [Kiritimatiellia bacterium]
MAFTLPIRYTDIPDIRALDLEKHGAPGVPVLGLTRIRRQTDPVREHVHPGVLEFGLCLRGALTLYSGDHRLAPIHFLLDCRIEKAKSLLSSTTQPITAIAVSRGN